MRRSKSWITHCCSARCWHTEKRKMTDQTQPINLPPFQQHYRASGVLLHVTSLPSRFGIGDMGPAAFSWIDRLHEAGQSWWQALPFGPTGHGDSPYQVLSSFGSNGVLLRPD